MSKITQLNEKAIAVEVLPELKDGPVFLDYEELHDEGWRRIGYANELTEEQWKGIVGQWRNGIYVAYPIVFHPITLEPIVFVSTAAESGLSLLKSKGLNPETTLILIKQ